MAKNRITAIRIELSTEHTAIGLNWSERIIHSWNVICQLREQGIHWYLVILAQGLFSVKPCPFYHGRLFVPRIFVLKTIKTPEICPPFHEILKFKSFQFTTSKYLNRSSIQLLAFISPYFHIQYSRHHAHHSVSFRFCCTSFRGCCYRSSSGGVFHTTI